MLGLRDDEHRSVLLPREGADEELEPGCERESLVRLLPAERHELLGSRSAREHVAVRHRSHGHVRDERVAVARGNRDRERVGPGQRWAALRMRKPTGRGRRQHRDQPALGEPPNPVAEHTTRETALGDHEPRARGRTRQRRPHDLLQDEIAERASSVPALEPFLGHDSGRPCVRVERRTTPASSTREKPCPCSSPPLRIREVRDERGDGVLVEPERREPDAGFLGWPRMARER